MIRSLLLGASLFIAAPVSAQAPATSSTAAAPDTAAVDAARRVVTKLWPLGTYRRMMDGSMSKMMNSMMETMFDMKASDMAGAVDPSGKAAKDAGDKSMGQVMAEADPHFRERFKITMDTMMAEMIPLFEKAEPGIRDSLTKIYAREFTAQQLTELDAFFGTPTGKVYGEKWMMTFVDPEMMKNMASFAPEMLRAMPDIMKKVEKATAHLPSPPKPKTEE